ncbi:MAG: sigma-70 family RNA polymerase sigma factor [Planctomycetota bacterium]|nr:sigma-70 family RNA polymerase sigma factor [Planctomycetota bacterium]
MTDLADRLNRRLLVIRCQVGDAAAFEELVGFFQPRLRGFLFKMVRGRQSVNDLAQDVWMDVFRDLGTLSNPEAFVPWFYRIARNRAFRALRRRPIMTEPIEPDALADETIDFTAEEAGAVHAALDELIPEHREVLLLRFMEEMSYEEIAGVVGCAVGTVRSRIHNGKVALRRIIECERHP